MQRFALCIAFNCTLDCICNILLFVQYYAMHFNSLVVETIVPMCAAGPQSETCSLCFIWLLCHHLTSHHYAIFIVMVGPHEHSTTVITMSLCYIFTAGNPVFHFSSLYTASSGIFRRFCQLMSFSRKTLFQGFTKQILIEEQKNVTHLPKPDLNEVKRKRGRTAAKKIRPLGLNSSTR